MPLAFFDLDGTLTRCDTFIPYCFIAFLHRPWRIFRLNRILIGCFLFLKGEIEREKLKQVFITTFLRGLTKKEIEKYNKIFLELFIPLILRKDIHIKMRFHQRQGNRVYIVSASPDIYVQTIAKQWNIEGAICTNLEWKRDCLTGRILGKNCRGREKARRIQSIFTQNELEGSYAYGNSEGDNEMLELASFGRSI